MLITSQTSEKKSDLYPFKKAQELAFEAAESVAEFIEPGWSEKQAANLLNTYLQDCGVKHFFHYGYVWFGERTRFDGIPRKNYFAYKPTDRILQENEVFILDVAPIVDGYICDIGYSSIYGESVEYKNAQNFLENLRREIPQLAVIAKSGADLWSMVDEKILEAGFDNIHAQYPFSVLGHRVHRVSQRGFELDIINFGWKSYWEFTKRGLFGELLGPSTQKKPQGLWAIEPHIGSKNFGIKFEEILMIENSNAYWISEV